ncbi:M14 family zinc carboxypeptidase [Gallaecimonas pentaromativorans]|uniref:M14 family zinc carboxypeptidase n=1 Tax=Gallaecimonas pentaromativorans TaxID=584787 RepID=UPI003A9122D4
MKRLIPLLLTPLLAWAQSSSEYFPGESFNPALPSPEAVLGFGIGERHLRFDEQQRYLAALAGQSDRIKTINIGQTLEGRQQVLLAISSHKNLARLEAIRSQHLQVLEGKAQADLPSIVWLGYSVHGDEPSGANAAPLVAYWLAASDTQEVGAILDNTVVLMDPALNPDGLDRYANYANNMQGQHNSDSLSHRTRWQDFPAGRLSHYGFDLNRDWLLLTHPASQNRIRFWQQWLPAVFGDFHEMGPDSTFFMQPGVASRVNPLTPAQNQALTRQLAQSVAKGMDQQQRLYFTGESYDDFYWGKASSYGDALGAIGILYEQARARGMQVATPFGEMSFTFTIENQLTASKALLVGVLANKAALASYQGAFFKNALALADQDKTKGYVLKNPGDQARLDDLAALLSQHGIKVSKLGEDISLGGEKLHKGRDLFIDARQPQYRLLKSVFSRQTEFEDNTFYDVSAWNLGLAYNIEVLPVGGWSYSKALNGKPWQPAKAAPAPVTAHYAWAFDWADSRAPALLADLLRAGIKVFALPGEADNGQVHLKAGDMLIPAGAQQPAELVATLGKLSRRHGLAIQGMDSGFSQSGVSLGSRGLQRVTLPKVGLLVGRDINAQRAGGVWQSLDTKAGLAVTLLDDSVLPWLDLREFTHLIVPAAAPIALNTLQNQRLAQWVQQGGHLVLMTDAVAWGVHSGLLNAELVDDKARLASFSTDGQGYGDKGSHRAQTLIAGTQVLADLDPSHPLNYGLGSDTLALMRDHEVMLAKVAGEFTVPARYDANPLLAGFMAPQNAKALAGTAAAVAQHFGQGTVVAFLDDVSFRGVQRGSERWLSNALYFNF